MSLISKKKFKKGKNSFTKGKNSKNNLKEVKKRKSKNSTLVDPPHTYLMHCPQCIVNICIHETNREGRKKSPQGGSSVVVVLVDDMRPNPICVEFGGTHRRLYNTTH